MRVSANVALMPATLFVATVVALAPRPAAAAYNLPWCATYYENSIRSCAFMSYEQCFATIAGPVGGVCTRNPAYPPRPPHVERHRVKPRVSRDH